MCRERMVPLAGLEPARLAAIDFESIASTNSTTGAPWSTAGDHSETNLEVNTENGPMQIVLR